MITNQRPLWTNKRPGQKRKIKANTIIIKWMLFLCILFKKRLNNQIIGKITNILNDEYKVNNQNNT